MTEANERTYHHGRLRPALLAAAERTLREQGIEQLSLRELARDVGVSHGAPRRHFRDRQELLDALAVTGFERLDAELRSALEQAGEAFAPRLGALVHAYIRFATQDAALLELMFTSKHRPGAERVAEAASTGLTLMHEVIVQGQADGALAAGDPEKIGIVLFATMQGIATLINGDMIRPELLDGLVDAAIAQFLRGAGPA
ncbi:TetR/AcrR family transcriptional regulator [Bogoriella caseilytica]|uniref:TetR family transcriptional regulator n=1 Tax=Bogoriella caseilytica TaxID=56055 RepID=A0A3N2BDN1_9MICO|nr:TetR/AcrR family transcriptional regulator [Bogoriella caseilytica]ROR73363.1 TetR family transcriptional regulator [Bogoriella caseilytica]